jgi:transcriptional regulator
MASIMENNQRAKQDFAFSKQMQRTKELCERGAALSSIAKIMMRSGITADEAMSNKYDQERIKLMMAEGVDGYDAEQLVRTDINVLLTSEVL